MEKMNGEGMNLVECNIASLKKLFPECVVDGKIDFGKLKIALGDTVENSGDAYSFRWVGKNDALKLSQVPTTCTLLPVKDKSLNWNNTSNIYIEGDNLESLKTIMKTYHEGIKMIYIDPPYNTGEDFVYNDNFGSNSSEYIENTNQKFHSNPNTSGRFHTNWLNMMYPRLKLAHSLLKESGVIFISIDDNEYRNLRIVCDEIFGEENHIATFIWRKRAGGGFGGTVVSSNHEYIVCYSKNVDFVEINDLDKKVENIDSNYPLSDNKGRYKRRDLRKSGVGDRREDRPTMFFGVKSPDGSLIYPKRGDGSDGRWTCAQSTFEKLLSDGEVEFVKVGENWKVYTKERPYSADGELKKEKNTSLLQDMPINTAGSKEIEILFGDKNIFPFPKPVDLISYFIHVGCNDGDTVLDFFSGSATTAQSVFETNVKYNSNIKFILVQLPEKIEPNHRAYAEGFRTICDIGEERIRRAGKKTVDELKRNVSNSGLLAEIYKKPESLDIGFKVFKLETSCIKPWDPTVKYDENSIFGLEDVIKEDRTNLDVAYEVMLKYGVFNMPLEEIQVNGKTVYSVGRGYMIISLNNEITPEDVEAIAKLQPKAVVFKESGFVDDNAKINADYTFKRLGIDNVKCI